MRLKKRKISKKAVALAIAASVAVAVPVSASAEQSYNADEGTVTVGSDLNSTTDEDGDTETSNDVYSYQGDEDSKKYDDDITIKGDGKSTDDDNADTHETIVDVKDNTKGADITIEDVKADVDSGAGVNVGTGAVVDIHLNDTDITAHTDAGISIGSKSKVELELAGINEIQGGDVYAGIYVAEDAEVDIKDDDKDSDPAGVLTVQGGEGGAGIGGNKGGSSGIINILSGIIKAKGGEGGAGIGGGAGKLTYDKDGNAVITGGNATAGITITGSDGTITAVTAEGGDYAAGIGGGQFGDGENIAIDGGANVTATSDSYGAGIGGGDSTTGTVATGTEDAHTAHIITEVGGGRGANITISGEGTVVTATGGGNKGIGTLHYAGGGTLDKIEKGGAGAAIGGGSYGDGSNISIYDGATVTATGIDGSAGIGGGSHGSGTGITIGRDPEEYPDDKHTTVTATGGKSNSAIRNSNSETSTSGSELKADEKAGLNGRFWDPEGCDGGGAGIGGGYGGDGTDITVTGDTKVTATGGTGVTGWAFTDVDSEKRYTLNSYRNSTELNSYRGGGAGIGSGGGLWEFDYKGNTKGNTVTTQGSKPTSGTSVANYQFTGVKETVGKNITISGGADVEAYGGASGGAGIGGGGVGGTGDTITITGAGTTVTAKGGNYGSTGLGDTTAYDSSYQRGDYGGAGIGGGSGVEINDTGIAGAENRTKIVGGTGTNITISDGATIEYAGGGVQGAGIGGGDLGDGTNIIIENAALKTVEGGAYAAGIGGGCEGDGDNIQILSSTADSITGGGMASEGGSGGGAGIGGGQSGTGSNILIKDSTLTSVTGGNAEGGAYGGAGIGGGASTGTAVYSYRDKSGRILYYNSGATTQIIYANASSTGGFKTYNNLLGAYVLDNTTGVYSYVYLKTDKGNYIKYDSSAKKYKVVNSAGEELAAETSLNDLLKKYTSYEVIEKVGADAGNGYNITVDNSTIENVTGGYGAAGIGGGYNGDGYGIEIKNGSTVNAYGGLNYGAGIGGGYNGDGYDITVDNAGGKVYAEGATWGAGIGGGCYGDGKNINIEDGTVEATSKQGAGIGGGYNGDGDGINISGGLDTTNVNATSTYGAGIGGGKYGDGKNITISGGTVYAGSEMGGAGIGGGLSYNSSSGSTTKGNASNIVISGGNVTAVGGGTYEADVTTYTTIDGSTYDMSNVSKSNSSFKGNISYGKNSSSSCLYYIGYKTDDGTWKKLRDLDGNYIVWISSYYEDTYNVKGGTYKVSSEIDIDTVAKACSSGKELVAALLSADNWVSAGATNDKDLRDYVTNKHTETVLYCGGGAGIGSGVFGSADEITVSGDAVVKAYGGAGAAGIGTGANAGVSGTGTGTLGSVSITGGDVTAIGGTYYDTTFPVVTYADTNGNALKDASGNDITSSDGFIKEEYGGGWYYLAYYDADGNKQYLLDSEGKKILYEVYNGADYYYSWTNGGNTDFNKIVKNCSATKTEEAVTVGGGAGVGTGAYSDVAGGITVSGSADLKAYGGAGGAGIGTGDASTAGTGSISIALDADGKVLAVGGEDASGIGGGRAVNADNNVASISIANQGQVRAFADGTKFAVDLTGTVDTTGSQGVLNGRFVDNTTDGDRDGTKEEAARGLTQIVDTKLNIVDAQGNTIAKITLPVYNRDETDDAAYFAALKNGFSDEKRLYNSYAANLTDAEGNDKSAQRVYVFDDGTLYDGTELYERSVAGTDYYSADSQNYSPLAKAAGWVNNNSTTLNGGKHVGLETSGSAMFTADEMQFPRYNVNYVFEYDTEADPTTLHGYSDVAAQLYNPDEYTVVTTDEEIAVNGRVYTVEDLKKDVTGTWGLTEVTGSYSGTNADGKEGTYSYRWYVEKNWDPSTTQSALDTSTGNLGDMGFKAVWTYEETFEEKKEEETPVTPDPTPTPIVPTIIEEENNDDDDDDVIPVVPAVTPVTPAPADATPATTVPTAETPVTPAPADAVPVAETPTTPAPLDARPDKLPQSGADWFSALSMAAAGLALSLGSLFGKGKHEKQ